MVIEKTANWWMHPPKVCIPLLPADAINGPEKGHCTAWEGDILPLDGSEPMRSVFKYLNHPGKLAVEMACAMTAAMLGNNVPRPCLLKVTLGQLPEMPSHAFSSNSTALLFCSTFISNSGFLEQLSQSNDATLDNSVWNHFCNDASTAAKGAALDELLANWDRHSRNMRFNGKHWWLIDHDNALTPALNIDTRDMDATFKASQNQIADQLRTRRPNDHQMADAALSTSKQYHAVLTLAAKAKMWTDSDQQVHAVWQKTAELIQLLSRRLPALQDLIGERIGANHSTSLQWTPTPKSSPPSSS